MKIMVLGDTHGEGQWLRDKIFWAKKNGIEKIVQVGDFGLWDHEEDGVRFLDWTNEALRKTGVKLVFLGGNHENWDHLDWYQKNLPKNTAGHIYVRSHILYTGRVNRWQWDGKWFQAVGGAVSIDKNWRTVGKSLWLQEAIPEPVVYGLEKAGRASDYLFTHDAPSCVPMRGLKPDADSTAHRQLMDRIGRAVRPTAWFHGHYHKWMEYSFMHQEGYSLVYGLDRDFQFWSHVILDTENDSVTAANGKTHFI
jgi:hypothetical protein